jgi:hypothetical protein
VKIWDRKFSENDPVAGLIESQQSRQLGDRLNEIIDLMLQIQAQRSIEARLANNLLVSTCRPQAILGSVDLSTILIGRSSFKLSPGT